MKRFLVAVFITALMVGGVTAAQAEPPKVDSQAPDVTCSVPEGGVPAGCGNCPNAPSDSIAQ